MMRIIGIEFNEWLYNQYHLSHGTISPTTVTLRLLPRTLHPSVTYAEFSLDELYLNRLDNSLAFKTKKSLHRTLCLGVITG